MQEKKKCVIACQVTSRAAVDLANTNKQLRQEMLFPLNQRISDIETWVKEQGSGTMLYRVVREYILREKSRMITVSGFIKSTKIIVGRGYVRDVRRGDPQANRTQQALGNAPISPRVEASKRAKARPALGVRGELKKLGQRKGKASNLEILWTAMYPSK